MIYNNGNVRDITLAYIGGGSRGWAWTFMTDLALEENISGTIRLYDIDQHAVKQNQKIGEQLSSREEVKGKWKYETVSSLKEAMTGADFIIVSILPGTFDEMDSDVHEAEKLGIYQSVGDTVGPGGIVRALRTIPMFAEIAEAVKAYAPKAWVINYTNPLSLCVKTLYRVFPEIKAFGCCHEVFDTQKLLCDVVKAYSDETDVSRSDIHVNVLGINHFTWFDRASYKGLDLFPLYRKFVEEHEDGYEEAERSWANSTFFSAHKVKFDLFKKYQWIAAAGDRHLAEFMPGEAYLSDPSKVKEWKFGLTTVEWRKSDLKHRLERSERLASGEKMELKSSGEEGILLIKALCGLERVISNVNMPNTYSQIQNLDTKAIVETNAVFQKDCILPVVAGSIPEEIRELIMPHVENHELILEAALDCDFAKAHQAFMNDPLVRGRISPEVGEKLLRGMIAKTMKYLPKEWEKEIRS